MQLLSQLARWVDVSSVPSLELPRTVAILGRTSVGKTTLLNALTGQRHRTGLGGVTRAPVACEQADWRWIDTPGIDSRDRALIELGPVLDESHAVIWVVDGLQPVTRTERDVLSLLLSPDQPLDVVVSRADLIADDLDAVMARVRAQTASFQPHSVFPLDLLHAPDLSALRHHRRTRGEQRALVTALRSLDQPLRAAQPFDAQSLAQTVTVRPRVRAWLERLEDRQHTVGDLLSHFGPELVALADTAVVEWAADPRLSERLLGLPTLPTPPDPSKSALDSFRLNAAGVAATLRELRGLAGSWVAETELRLADWRDEQRFDEPALAAHSDAVDALSAELRELGHQDDER